MTSQSDELRVLHFVEVQKKMLNLAVTHDDATHERFNVTYDVHINESHTGTMCDAGASAMEKSGEARSSAHEHVARRKEGKAVHLRRVASASCFDRWFGRQQFHRLLWIRSFQKQMDIEHARMHLYDTELDGMRLIGAIRTRFQERRFDFLN